MGPARVLDDVGAGVGDVFAKLAPLPGGGEQGAQYLEGAVGCAGPVRARCVEPCGNSGMVDGIQPESSELRHQPVPHVDIVGLQRGPFPAMLAPLAVADGEIAEQRRSRLTHGRNGLARPQAGEDGGGFPACLLDAHLGEAPEGELAHPALHAGLGR